MFNSSTAHFWKDSRSGYLKKPNRSLQSSQSKKNPYKRGRKIRKSFQQQNIEKKNICLLRVSFKKNFLKRTCVTYLHSLFSGQWKIGCRNFFSQKIKVHVPYVHNFLDHLLGKNIEIEIWQISLNSEGLLMIMAKARVLDGKYWTSLILTLMKKWHFQQLYIRCVSQSCISAMNS